MCKCWEFDRSNLIYLNKKDRVYFCDEIEFSRGEEKFKNNKGIYVSRDSGQDTAFIFNYCPWCGVKFEEVKNVT